MRTRFAAVTAALLLAGPPLLSACGGGGDSGSAKSGDNVLTLWHFEDPTAATAISWKEAIAIFEKETGAKVKFESKSFEQIRSTASQVLNSNQAPDILEYPKGNATAGLLSSQGLLTDITSQVQKYHWDKVVSGSLATTSQYDDKGVMGSGPWYGVTDYGEYVQVYYNKDMFSKYGVKVPTTFDEFTAALQKFKGAGVTPLAEAGGEYPLGQLFYQLALTKANRAWVDAYQVYKGTVNWHGPELTFAANTLKDWVDKGYIDKNITGLKAQDMENTFASGKAPIMLSGSWWQGTVANDAKFNWDTFLFPGSTMAMGSGGNLWVVPQNSKDKDLAYKFIDITLRPQVQNILGNKGSVPVNAQLSAIKDPKSKQLIVNFKTVNDRNGLAFYPDWPTPTFYDQLVAATQQLVNGSITPDAMLTQLGSQYEAGVKSINK
jgi:raffinose/stachyose/melibiose transport system substrate-binding protein